MPLQQLSKQEKYVEVTIPAVPSLLSVPLVTAMILTLESGLSSWEPSLAVISLQSQGLGKADILL